MQLRATMTFAKILIKSSLGTDKLTFLECKCSLPCVLRPLWSQPSTHRSLRRGTGEGSFGKSDAAGD